MTAPGFTRGHIGEGARARIRERLGIAEDAIAFGLAGSLRWNDRVGYAYGAELIQAVRRVERADVVVCVIGDGDGRARLEEMAGDDLGTRVLLPGRVPPAEVPDHLAALDAGSLSQSVDQVGAFRYTTKLAEYFAASLPVLSGEVPLAYDLDEGGMWVLPGSAPWSPTYVAALARLLETVTREEVEAKREAVRARTSEPFDLAEQQRRIAAFLASVLAERDGDAQVPGWRGEGASRS